MKALAILALFIAVVAAAVVSVQGSVSGKSPLGVFGVIVLVLAAGIQRIASVQRVIDQPRRARTKRVRAILFEALIELCKDNPVTDDAESLRIHVWEIPRWYRLVFPYKLRLFLKRLTKIRRLTRFARWDIRPSMNRVATVGLSERPPTGIRIRKGVGTIGVCLALNQDKAQALDVSKGQYGRALRSKTQEDWEQNFTEEVRHGLTLAQAQNLSERYGQILSQLVRNPTSGEPIGVVTISVRSNRVPWLQVAAKGQSPFKRQLRRLIQPVSEEIA